MVSKAPVSLELHSAGPYLTICMKRTHMPPPPPWKSRAENTQARLGPRSQREQMAVSRGQPSPSRRTGDAQCTLAKGPNCLPPHEEGER